MAKEKTAVIVGNWKFVKMDPLNWQLFEHAEVEKGPRKGELDWVKRPNYFGDLANAIVYARNREFERGGATMDLDEAIERLQAVDAKFVKAVRKAVSL